MNALKLEIVRFQDKDVIAASGPAFDPLTAGQTYVTSHDEYIQGGGRETGSSYAIIRFLYNPGGEDHLAVFGAGGASSGTKFNGYTYAWYEEAGAGWVTEGKTRGEYGGSFPT